MRTIASDPEARRCLSAAVSEAAFEQISSGEKQFVSSGCATCGGF
jgi:hypothetical protein